MRISGGEARGIELAVPKGDAVRPATDGTRQAVFSSLGNRVAGARFVDLFAGSGAYGLEAFSRGASGGTFVERNAKASACLRKNIAAVCRSMKSDGRDLTAVEADALSLPAGVGEPPDLVFADPPYDAVSAVAPVLFGKLSALLPPTWPGIVVFEMPGEVTLAPQGWVALKRIGRGRRQPSAVFFTRVSPAPAGDLTGEDIPEGTAALTRQLLEWISQRPRSYAEVLDAWRTSCPRLSIWEDACIAGLIAYEPDGERIVSVSPKGQTLLASRPST